MSYQDLQGTYAPAYELEEDQDGHSEDERARVEEDPGHTYRQAYQDEGADVVREEHPASVAESLQGTHLHNEENKTT